MNLLKNLNDQQKEAVLFDKGPLLILAGAGSGKTRVITYRIAYLIKEKKINPWNILAVTFTNKAAKEMNDRLCKLVDKKASNISVGTFHSICNRILRIHIKELGFSRDFTIFDRSDQLSLIKAVLKKLNIDENNFKPTQIINLIQQAKNKLISPEDYSLTTDNNFYNSRIATIYKLYQQDLASNNALDFDDMLIFTLRIFKNNSEILKHYQDLWKYIFVDEYQDTNHIQYQLVKLLSSKHKNICVVGDDDQSIYRWRGADLNNILNFEKDYTTSKIIRLEQNYRSTQNILNVANAIINKNLGRKGKTLWTSNKSGEKTFYYQAETEHDEARFISSTIKDLSTPDKLYNNFAILYRTNAQSRMLEDVLRKDNIPYNLIGSLSFYGRKEIKDIIAYLRIINNPNDNISIKRIINIPSRGIGEATINLIEKISLEQGVNSLFIGLQKALEQNLLPTRAKNSISGFLKQLETFSLLAKDKTLSDFISQLITDLNYIDYLKDMYHINARTKIENIKELINAVLDFEQQSENKTLADFLDQISLTSDIDDYSEEEGKVALMTMHCAKGLEFPIVFITGIEEGLFPHINSFDDPEELEEERRLCYVAMTRAQQRLYLINSKKRRTFGKYHQNSPSRFIDEIPSELLIQKTYKKSPESILTDYNHSNIPVSGKKLIHHRAVSKNDFFNIGVLVKHPIWGKGKITSREGTGDNIKVIVDFLGKKKKLSLKYARLEKL